MKDWEVAGGEPTCSAGTINWERVQEDRLSRGKDGKQHQALYLEHMFSTNVIRIDERHKYMLPNPLDLIILHTSTNSQGN